MRRLALLAALTYAPAAYADDAALTAALSERTVDYSVASQTFYQSGRTLYTADRESWSTWEIRGDRYCSQWPPASGWAYYDIVIDGDTVSFTGASGETTSGTFRAAE